MAAWVRTRTSSTWFPANANTFLGERTEPGRSIEEEGNTYRSIAILMERAEAVLRLGSSPRPYAPNAIKQKDPQRSGLRSLDTCPCPSARTASRSSRLDRRRDRKLSRINRSSWCSNWCRAVLTSQPTAPPLNKLPAKVPLLGARPAGFEPATGGLEVPGNAFATVHRRAEKRLFKPISG